MPRSIVALVGLLCLSCSSQSPVESKGEKAALGEAVAINGELYRRVMAKATAAQDDAVITISIPVSSSGGNITIADEITIAGRTYTANCGGGSPSTTSDDVGNTRSAATNLTVRYADSAADDPGYWSSSVYQLSRGDVDYFRLRVTRRVWLGVLSHSTIDLKGKLMNDQGRVLVENDDGPANEAGDFDFFVVTLVNPGTYYLEVKGARSSTNGPYSLGVGTWHESSGKPVAELDNRQVQLEQLARH